MGTRHSPGGVPLHSNKAVGVILPGEQNLLSARFSNGVDPLELVALVR